MSDTPRTDAGITDVIPYGINHTEMVHPHVAKQLERELAAAQDENAELWKSNKMLLEQFGQEQAENLKLRDAMANGYATLCSMNQERDHYRTVHADAMREIEALKFEIQAIREERDTLTSAVDELLAAIDECDNDSGIPMLAGFSWYNTIMPAVKAVKSAIGGGK